MPVDALILRRGDVADVLGVGETQIKKWSRSGLLTPIKLPGIRAVGYSTDEVRALARTIIETGRRTTPEAV
jgi:predicted site-specific integrase-resolvase